MERERLSRKRTRDSDSESSRRSRSRSSRCRNRASRPRERSRDNSKRKRRTSNESRERLDRDGERRSRETTARHSRASDERRARHCASPRPRHTTNHTGIAPNHSDSNNLLSTFKELIQAMKNEGSNDRFPALNVVPEFDPSKRNQTVDMWITKVNECAMIYGWTERQIIHYALPKLCGLAQKWYQGLPSLMFSWAEWENKLRLAFPSDENYGQLLSEMLACKARFGDSLEEYFYEKIVLLNRCNIFNKNAIDCILFGIEDRSVRMSAEAVQFTDPDKLLVYLRNVKFSKRSDKDNINMQPSTFDNRLPKSFKLRQNNPEHKILTKCYNCGKEGHPYFKCKQPIKRCDACHKIGHLVNDCQTKKESGINRTSDNSDSNTDEG